MNFAIIRSFDFGQLGLNDANIFFNDAFFNVTSLKTTKQAYPPQISLSGYCKGFGKLSKLKVIFWVKHCCLRLSIYFATFP